MNCATPNATGAGNMNADAEPGVAWNIAAKMFAMRVHGTIDLCCGFSCSRDKVGLRPDPTAEAAVATRSS